MTLKNESLAQFALGPIELQFRLGDVRSSNPGGVIGQRFKRKQGRSLGIAGAALLARKGWSNAPPGRQVAK
jgi:hypothetical protein